MQPLQGLRGLAPACRPSPRGVADYGTAVATGGTRPRHHRPHLTWFDAVAARLAAGGLAGDGVGCGVTVSGSWFGRQRQRPGRIAIVEVVDKVESLRAPQRHGKRLETWLTEREYSTSSVPPGVELLSSPR